MALGEVPISVYSPIAKHNRTPLVEGPVAYWLGGSDREGEKDFLEEIYLRSVAKAHTHVSSTSDKIICAVRASQQKDVVALEFRDRTCGR